MARRVLLAWEFGEGLAHVMLLAGVARELRALSENIELVFALRDIDPGLSVGIDAHLIVETPRRFIKPGFTPLTTLQPHRTFGGMIGEALVDESWESLRYFEEWDLLIAAARPDVIIADYAPSATMLAAKRVPAVACGIGYSLPPVDLPTFPPVTKAAGPFYASEEELLERFNVVLRHVGARVLERLPQINEADAYGLCTVPDLDPYADFPGRDWLGSIMPDGVPVMEDRHSGGLAYFHQKQQFDDAILDGLIRSGVEIDIYMGEPMRRTRKRTQGTSLRLSDEPFSLRRAMPGRAVAIHQGSLGFCSAAAFAGVPQVMLPRHQEHYSNSRSLVAKGVGIIVKPAQRTAAELARVIRETAESETMREAARVLAVSLEPWRNANPARVIAERALALAS